jgi:hypothetical protein
MVIYLSCSNVNLQMTSLFNKIDVNYSILQTEMCPFFGNHKEDAALL